MKFVLFTMVVLSMATLCGCASGLDDSYTATVEEAVRSVSSPEKAAHLRELLLSSKNSWRQQPSYGAVRNLVADLDAPKRQLRIEVGNINAGTYRVAWIVETDSSVVAFFNVFSGGNLKRATVPRDEWDKVLRIIIAKQGELTRCKSDLAVDDGSSYFGIIAVGQKVQKFAVYGFIPFPPGPGTEELYGRLAPCSEIVKGIYSLLPSGV
jgi:hypothetical protein